MSEHTSRRPERRHGERNLDDEPEGELDGAGRDSGHHRLRLSLPRDQRPRGELDRDHGHHAYRDRSDDLELDDGHALRGPGACDEHEGHESLVGLRLGGDLGGAGSPGRAEGDSGFGDEPDGALDRAGRDARRHRLRLSLPGGRRPAAGLDRGHGLDHHRDRSDDHGFDDGHELPGAGARNQPGGHRLVVRDGRVPAAGSGGWRPSAARRLFGRRRQARDIPRQRVGNGVRRPLRRCRCRGRLPPVGLRLGSRCI